MILLALIVGGFIAFIYYCLVFWGAILGIGASKLEFKGKNSFYYLDEKIGEKEREKLCSELVEEGCNCSFQYDIRQKYFNISLVNKENEQKAHDILIKYGVKNFRIV